MRSDHPQGSAVRPAGDHDAAVQNPFVAAVLATDPVFVGVEGSLAREVPVQGLADGGEVVRMNAAFPFPQPVGDLVVGIAEHALPVVREEDLVRDEIPVPDSVADRLQGQPPAFLRFRQPALGLLQTALVAALAPGEPGDHQRGPKDQGGDDGAPADDLVPARHVAGHRLPLAEEDVNHQRIIPDPAVGGDAGNAVERAGQPEDTGVRRRGIEEGAVGQRGADRIGRRGHRRRPRADDPVLADQRDHALPPHVGRLQKAGEDGGIGRQDEDAAEGTVRRPHAPGELDRPFAGHPPKNRPADEQRVIPALPMHPEMLAIAEVEPLRGSLQVAEQQRPVGTDGADLEGQIGVERHLPCFGAGGEGGGIPLELVAQMDERLIEPPHDLKDVFLVGAGEVGGVSLRLADGEGTLALKAARCGVGPDPEEHEAEDDDRRRNVGQQAGGETPDSCGQGAVPPGRAAALHQGHDRFALIPKPEMRAGPCMGRAWVHVRHQAKGLEPSSHTICNATEFPIPARSDFYLFG